MLVSVTLVVWLVVVLMVSLNQLPGATGRELMVKVPFGSYCHYALFLRGVVLVFGGKMLVSMEVDIPYGSS